MNKPKLENVTFVSGRSLHPTLRKKFEIAEDEFAEVRVERVNPASTKVVKMTTTPGKKFAGMVKQSGVDFSF